MKFLKILSEALHDHVARFSTWLYFIVLFGFTLVMNLVTTPGDGVYANNTFHITATTVIGVFIWLIMGASIAGESAARDIRTRIYPLIFSTPITKFHYLGGRFLAAFLINALLIAALPLGVLLSFYLPGINDEALLPFRPLAYLNVYFLVALPTVFVTTALQFTLAALTRKVMSSYLASLLLAIIAQVIAIAAAKLFGNWDLVKLLDPAGVTGIIGNELQTWTATEKNTRLITLEGMFLWNRILWICAALGFLVFTYLRFRFAYPEVKNSMSRFRKREKVKSEKSLEPITTKSTAVDVLHFSPTFGYKTWFRQSLKIAWTSFSKIALSPAGLSLVSIVTLVYVLFADKIISEFGIPLIPTTRQVLTYLAVPVGNIGTPYVVISLLIMYYAGELIWKERDAGLSDIADATSIPGWAVFTGKFLGLALLILVWLVLMMTGGILMQLSMGYHKLEPGLYLQTLFGFQFVDYLLFALLVLVVHVMVNKKYPGYLAVLLVFIFIAFHSTFGVEHNLLIFGADPGWQYTDMRGFGATLLPWLWFKAYWIAWGLLLAVAATLLWARGREQSLKHRFRLAQRHFKKSTARLAIIALSLILISGSVIFYNTNVLNEYVTGADVIDLKAKYEQRYGKYRNSPQPQLTATKLNVEIFPDRQELSIDAAYTLLNNDSLPIDSIHIGSISGIQLHEVKFNRPVVNVLRDKELSHHIYALKQPLQQGDSLQLTFTVSYKQEGFRNNVVNPLVAKNGTYFTNFDMLPSIGYQPYLEIKDAVIRKKYQLPSRPAPASLYDETANKKPLTTDHNRFEAIIGTAKDEVAIAPGTLQKSWTKDDRHYFHFKTNAPIRGEYSILSGKYLVKESQWNDVAITLYFHPTHAHNVDRMLRSIRSSLDHYTKQWGPYPYSHFTAAGHAGASAGMHSEASMVVYGETTPLLNPDVSPGGFDLPFYIMAHEVAHQWWGGAGLAPANVEGAGVLVEGLAVYSGMQVLEKNYGQRHLQRYVDYLHDSYAMPRSLASATLLRADESFLYYRKGGLAMYALSKYIGKEKVNGALRHLLDKHRSGALPVATTLDLYRELQKVTPDSLIYLLHSMFYENAYWRLKTEKFTATQTTSGNWQATLSVNAEKVLIDSTGAEKEVPMNDWLEIGIYEEGKSLDEPLYLQMHRIKPGTQTITVTVPGKPGSGGIDPNKLMIDLRPDDNVRDLEGP